MDHWVVIIFCFVHRISFIHTAVTNLDSKSIQASVPVGPDAKMGWNLTTTDLMSTNPSILVYELGIFYSHFTDSQVSSAWFKSIATFHTCTLTCQSHMQTISQTQRYTCLPVSICSHTQELTPYKLLNMSLISLNFTHLPFLSWSHSSAH